MRNFTSESDVYTGHILGMGSANERRRYYVTSPLIGWANIQNDPWYIYKGYTGESVHISNTIQLGTVIYTVKHYID